MTSLPAPHLTPSETLQHLRDERYGDLDAYLNRVQRDYERGLISERELNDAYRPFATEFYSIGEKLNAWRQQHDDSYAVHQAFAGWLLAQAWRMRGGTTFDLVSDRGQRGLQYYLEQAQYAARHAATLTDKPLLAHLTLGSVHCTHGNDLTNEDVSQQRWPGWFREGVALDPESLLLRTTLLQLLRTEWGGSDAQMLTFIRSQEAQLSSSANQKLWAQFNAQISHHALHFLQDADKALEYARYAVNLDPRYRYELAYVYHFTGHARDARETYLNAVADDLRDPRAALPHKAVFLARHLVLETTEQARLVARALEREASSGDLDAVTTLGVLLTRNPALTEPHTPRHWFERALEEGDFSAGPLLIEHVRDTSGSDAEVMQAALFAADEGCPEAAATVWENWKAFRTRFKLDDRAKYTYLLRAADGGNNQARVDLARLLRRGRAELGSDGVLRPVHTKPTKESLEYATYLESRAQHEGHDKWRSALRRFGGPAWSNLPTKRKVALVLFGVWVIAKLASVASDWSSPPRASLTPTPASRSAPTADAPTRELLNRATHSRQDEAARREVLRAFVEEARRRALRGDPPKP